MTTQTLSHTAVATQTSASLIKRIGSAAYRLLERMSEAAYRLLERMSEAAYRQHAPRLRNNYYL
ncbi:hypothetical protein HOP51_20565 [Halomonas sp. MCCC 1A11036]|uniref:Uncharacterized protein n=1 Tax=Billgrantia zhangzhouensis TaxID=2733481 RepID=A0ABS9AL03_9GAMM|nr:hypothetical protein [Halomonas zhangzhouensis]MCE8022483.1 hypothetical protein [Halomonas zhangzhouensis]